MSGFNMGQHCIRRGKRAAFTLVEMLVVIAIIGILAALTAVGVSKVIGIQRSSNTQNTIRTVHKVLMEHWASVIADANKETGLDAPFQTINSIFGSDPTGERNRIIWIKMRLMEAFPVGYLEVARPFPYASNIIPVNMRKYNAGYLAPIQSRTPSQIKSAAPGTESAACLLMALSVMRNGVSLSMDNLGTSNVTDTDGDGVPEIIDAWGNPLAFFRFPTDSVLLQTSNPALGNKNAATLRNADPVDPGGTLLTFAAGPAALKTQFESTVHKLISPITQGACYIVPTVVSSGPDGVLGLDQSIANNMKVLPKMDAFAADNIYSFQLR